MQLPGPNFSVRWSIYRSLEFYNPQYLAVRCAGVLEYVAYRHWKWKLQEGLGYLLVGIDNNKKCIHKLIITLWRPLNSAWKGGHRLVKVKLMYGTSAVLFPPPSPPHSKMCCSGNTVGLQSWNNKSQQLYFLFSVSGFMNRSVPSCHIFPHQQKDYKDRILCGDLLTFFQHKKCYFGGIMGRRSGLCCLCWASRCMFHIVWRESPVTNMSKTLECRLED